MGRRAAYEFGAGPAGRPGPGCPARRRACPGGVGRAGRGIFAPLFLPARTAVLWGRCERGVGGHRIRCGGEMPGKAGPVSGGRALFTTWVYGFAKNVLRNHHRKRARRDQIWEEVRKDQSAWWHEPPPDEPHFGGDPLRWVIHQEKLEALHLAMADLPVNDEVILTLRVAKARPEAETARQLKLEDEEAEKLYRCALELLRERFFRYYYGVPRRKRVGQPKSA